MEKKRGVEMTQEKIKTVCVDKMAYEAVLRNSIKVNDLEAENQQLKELLLVCRKILEKETYDLMVKKIDNAIGEKK